MMWNRRPGGDAADPHGVAELLGRVGRHLGPPSLLGRRLLCSTAQMVRLSRRVEAAASTHGGPLYVGVQEASRLDAQADVYTSLLDRDVEVVAFGSGGRPDVAVEWVAVPVDRHAVASQWLLARPGLNARALVGFEISPPARVHRVWEGFLTSDTRLVDSLVRHLEGVRAAAVG